MSGIQPLAKKFRRAITKATGVRFTLDDLQVLAGLGALEALQLAEAKELQSTWQKKTPPTSSDNIGSTSDVTEKARKPGKSPGMTSEQEQSAMRALVAAMQ